MIEAVIEAKKRGTTLAGVEPQTLKYQGRIPGELPAFLVDGHLPYGYESTGSETWFTCRMDPEPTARRVFWFHQPGTLEWQIEDHVNHGAGMATGSGKTFCAANVCERLIRHAEESGSWVRKDAGVQVPFRHRDDGDRCDRRERTRSFMPHEALGAAAGVFAQGSGTSAGRQVFEYGVRQVDVCFGERVAYGPREFVGHFGAGVGEHGAVFDTVTAPGKAPEQSQGDLSCCVV